MATRIGKVTYAKINGQNYRCKHDTTYTPGGVESEPMAADGKAYVGQSEEPVTSTFEITLLEANDTNLVDLKNLKDFAVDMIHDTGQVYRIADANWSEPPSFSQGEISASGFGREAKKVI
jgi:hypothetical protein